MKIVGVIMGKIKRKEEDIFNKILYLFIVVIGFTFAFSLLINKHQESSLADVYNEYFHESTIVGKQIVAKDVDCFYPKYYIALFMGMDYVVQEINYYETESQFKLDFSRNTYRIIDYDKSKKMIHNEITVGRGIYTEVLNDFASIVGAEKIVII